MGTGRIIDNYTYYEGFEDEPEIFFTAEDENMQVLHIWDGYLDDIFPSLTVIVTKTPHKPRCYAVCGEFLKILSCSTLTCFL